MAGRCGLAHQRRPGPWRPTPLVGTARSPRFNCRQQRSGRHGASDRGSHGRQVLPGTNLTGGDAVRNSVASASPVTGSLRSGVAAARAPMSRPSHTRVVIATCGSGRDDLRTNVELPALYGQCWRQLWRQNPPNHYLLRGTRTPSRRPRIRSSQRGCCLGAGWLRTHACVLTGVLSLESFSRNAGTLW